MPKKRGRKGKGKASSNQSKRGRPEKCTIADDKLLENIADTICSNLRMGTQVATDARAMQTEQPQVALSGVCVCFHLNLVSRV